MNQRMTRPYSIICVNDCSSDKTGAIMDEFKREFGLSDSFLKIIHNKERRGAMANMYHTIHAHCKDTQIVALVDGDDYLAHKGVVERLEHEYSDPHLWMTYGQFIFYPSGQWGTTYEIKRNDLEQKKIRSLVYVAQHLRTFKASLFKKIKKSDLQVNGAFYTMNADMATMIPMLEMCAPRGPNAPCHSKFIPDILYIYNYDNPINDHRVSRQTQLDLEAVIRALPTYQPLESLE
jgi:glycosyltransferase involved in cell wall biosynthesis